MRFVNSIVLSGPDTADATGIAIDANQLVSASFQIIFGDAAAGGTFKLQASNDIAPVSYMSTEDFTPVDWTDIPSQTATITAGASALLTIPQMSYRWIRAIFTSSDAGSTTVVVKMFALSV